jgi:hypothetical protein
MAELCHHLKEIADPDSDPDSGDLIVVACTDPVSKLYTTNQISPHQRAAVDAYVNDAEAMDGRLRAPSRGPEDTSWRGRRADAYGQRGARDRLERAHKLLGPDRSRLLCRILIDGCPLINGDIRELHRALDQLAVAYGFSTATRH